MLELQQKQKNPGSIMEDWLLLHFFGSWFKGGRNHGGRIELHLDASKQLHTDADQIMKTFQ